MPPPETYKMKIQNFYRRHRRMPSYAEIMTLVGFKSKSPAYKLVAKLIDLGIIEKDATGRLIPKSLSTQIPVLGTVEANWPSPAEEELLDTITLEEYLMPNKAATKILRVKGDSMIEAGIMPGDQALVEFGAQPRNGNIVIAEVDGGWTMKYFQKRGNEITLIPANKKYKPIIPKEELRITAVVRSIIRKY
jgi:repressor LexA